MSQDPKDPTLIQMEALGILEACTFLGFLGSLSFLGLTLEGLDLRRPYLFFPVVAKGFKESAKSMRGATSPRVHAHSMHDYRMTSSEDDAEPKVLVISKSDRFFKDNQIKTAKATKTALWP